MIPNQTYTIIIPAYNEAEIIESALERIQHMTPAVEVIVVDGGSKDSTAHLARCCGAKVIHSPRGRGIQCNAGTKLASGKVLLYLHADTFLPDHAFGILDQYFKNENVQIGTFRLSFDEDRSLLRFYSSFTKFDSIFTRFGDQCIVVRKSFLEQIGGFPDWPLFEDVHFLRKARRVAKIHSFPASVITSARRFVRIGLIRTQLINAWLILLYFLGVSPEILAGKYAHILTKDKGPISRRPAPELSK